MTLSDRDREIVRRAVAELINNPPKRRQRKRRQTHFEPPPPTDARLEVEAPVNPQTRPKIFRGRCWLCGAPCERILCHAHSWVKGD